jgi:predicted outer membrane repeat protein
LISASAALADVVITTDGEDKATIDGDYLDRVFHVMGAQVRLLNLNLRGGNPGADDGGNILNVGGQLTLDGVQISSNEAEFGGGIGSDGGELALVDSGVTLSSGTVGGGIAVMGGTAVTLTNSLITRNQASQGGGIYVAAGDNTMTIMGGSVSSNNSLDGAGGGLFIATENPISLNVTDVSGNGTTNGLDFGHGGGIYLAANSVLNVTDTTINNNEAEAFGGGVYSLGTVVMMGTDVMTNTAVSGGGVHIGEGQAITVTNGQFVGNQSLTNTGGGIHATHATVYDTLFEGNQALAGGAIYTDNLWAYGSIFRENMAQNWGGAVQVMEFVVVEESQFLGNDAEQSGGGILFNTNVAEVGSYILNSVFYDNRVFTDNGGGIWTNGSLAIANTTLSDNVADESNGGGLFVGVAGNVTLTNVSLVGNIANNGLNIFKEGEVTLQNTLLAHAVPNCGAVATPFISLGNNLVDDDSCDGLDEPTDQTNVDAMVSFVLADNGGDTLTHALLEGSPAIDMADDAACEGGLVNGRDQRGMDRSILGDACDIGAFEFGNSYALYLPFVTKTQ